MSEVEGYMRVRSFIPVVVAILMLCVSAQADSNLKFWIGGGFDYNTFSLEDVNDEVNFISAQTGLPGDEIDGGMGIVFRGGLETQSGLAFGAGWEHFSGSTEISDPTGGVKWDVGADAFFGIIEYNFPSQSPLSFGLGGSLGMIKSAGEFTLRVVGSGSASPNFDGSGLYAEGRLIGNFAVSPSFFITPSIGYRLANISEVKMLDQVLLNMEGNEYSLNYSGMTARLAVKLVFDLGKSSAE